MQTMELERTTLKRKRVSKKSKRSWRKHTDVHDVEEYLEGRRREEVFGLPASEKAAEDLFFKSTDSHSSGAKRLTRKEIRSKPLGSEIKLQSISTVKGFPSQPRKVVKRKSSPLGSEDSSSDEDFDRSASYKAISKEFEARLATRAKLCPEKSTLHVGCSDLWADEPEATGLNRDDHYLKVTRKKKVQKPKHEVPSLLKQVEFPHPGMSYNPTFEDHQDLLRKALSVEEKKQRAALKLERRLQLAKMTHEERDKVWTEEMSEGLPGRKEGGEVGGGEKEDVEEEEEGCGIVKHPVRAEERKTKKQRRKEQLRRKEEMLKKIAKVHKLKMDEVYRLRSIKREIAQKEAAVSKSKALTLALKQQSPFLTKRLGKYVFEESTIPFQLSSEVTGSLRSLKPEGSLAEERFKSLQKRNIIEPRERVRPHRKYKLLIKEKRSAKIPEDKTC